MIYLFHETSNLITRTNLIFVMGLNVVSAKRNDYVNKVFIDITLFKQNDTDLDTVSTHSRAPNNFNKHNEVRFEIHKID